MQSSIQEDSLVSFLSLNKILIMLMHDNMMELL